MNNSLITPASGPSARPRRFQLMAGGDPNLPPEAAAQLEQTVRASATEDQPGATTAPAPSGGTSETPGDAFQAPFRLEDVDPTYREHVERYVKQVQGAFTRKTQELAEQRKTLAPVEALHAALNGDDEAARDQAISELLTQHGWAVEGDEPPAEPQATPTPSADVTVDPALEARLAAIEQAEQARQAAQAEADQAAYQDQFVERFDTAVTKWAKANGRVDKDGTVPEYVRNGIAAHLRGLAPLVEGEMEWPDMDGALTLYDAQLAAERQYYLDTKDTPQVDASGASGTPKFDYRDPKQRLAAANAIAGRHL